MRLFTIILCFLHSFSNAQLPQFNYTLLPDTVHFSGFAVTLKINSAPSDFKMAMAAHPEYDDMFWRYVKNFTVSGGASFRREDSAIWHITNAQPEIVIRYFIELPANKPGPRAAWQPFLANYGGIGGGMHTFMYMLGHEDAKAAVSLQLPTGWVAATQLKNSGKPFKYTAQNAEELFDAQIMFGKLHQWYYRSGNADHLISYLSAKEVLPFDTAELAKNLQHISVQAEYIFGKLPYKEFNFLLSDDAYGALEHKNSTIAAGNAQTLVENPAEFYQEITHEYFHAWNLVRIKPAEWRVPVYKDPPLAKTLWWLEGATLFYADLIPRRAHLPAWDSTRVLHLQTVLKEYYASPGSSRFSAEEISLAANGPADMLGDYTASTHTQGEVISAMLDCIIRSRTNGKKNLDNLMAMLMNNFGNGKKFTSADVQKTMKKVCGDDAQDLFQQSVFGKKTIDVNRYLDLIGLSCITDKKLTTNDKATPDLRFYLYRRKGEIPFRIKITDPESVWGEAGLHTGDILLKINDETVKGNRELFRLVAKYKAGDEVLVEIKRNDRTEIKKITIRNYAEPLIIIKEKKGLTGLQVSLLSQWKTGY